MRKMLLTFLLCVFMCIPFTFVSAEEEAESVETVCSYKEKSELSKLANAVKVNQEVVDNGDGTYKFKYTVYNLSENISVMIAKEPEDVPKTSWVITAFEAAGGTYTFYDEEYNAPIPYSFVISGQMNQCSRIIKTINMIQPFYNRYHDYDDCKLDSTQDSYYCQQWIKKSFNLAESEVLKKIESAKQTVERITTTKCFDCDTKTRSNAKQMYYEGVKIIATTVFSIAIVVCILYIYFKLDGVRRSSI